MDFRNLNKASPKDDFPLPHIHMLVDSAIGHAMLSFMDGFPSSNQILMAPEDRRRHLLSLSRAPTVIESCRLG